MSSTTIDWTAFGLRRSLTFDDLRRYSAADLDPYTVQVGEALCENLVFSQRGQRNLVATFDSLPGKYYRAVDFEVGYGAYHVVRVILKTDTGFTLAALVGLLAEYFKEDVVVDFFVELAKRARVPDAYTPLRHQWRRLVDVLYGILSTSSFSTLLTALEDGLPIVSGKLDARKLVQAVIEMSTAVGNKETQIHLSAGTDIVWLVAIAIWVFDLKYAVQSPSSETIHTSSSTSAQTSHVTFTMESLPDPDPSLLQPSPTTSSSTETPITGGRVSFEQFFRVCFGDAASILKDDALAMYICSASNLLRDALSGDKLISRSPFLAQASTTHGKANYGLTESMTAWFPELRQQTTKFQRYSSLDSIESHKTFNEATHLLRQQCHCPACTEPTSNPPPFCKLTLAEVIFNLGFYIRLMVITPKLHPKRNGVRNFYHQCHTTRLLLTSSPSSPSTLFPTNLITHLSSSLHTLQISALLFANTSPTTLTTDTTTKDLMGITTTGLTVYLTGLKQFPPDDDNAANEGDERALNVIVSPGWICLFGHEARFEVYEPAYLGLSFEEIWENARVRTRELRQMMRWEGRVMVTSFVGKEGEEEERARRDGWILL